MRLRIVTLKPKLYLATLIMAHVILLQKKSSQKRPRWKLMLFKLINWRMSFYKPKTLHKVMLMRKWALRNKKTRLLVSMMNSITLNYRLEVLMNTDSQLKKRWNRTMIEQLRLLLKNKDKRWKLPEMNTLRKCLKMLLSIKPFRTLRTKKIWPSRELKLKLQKSTLKQSISFNNNMSLKSLVGRILLTNSRMKSILWSVKTLSAWTRSMKTLQLKLKESKSLEVRTKHS